MTAFIAHAVADEETAAALAKAIERRGQFVEFEHADRIGRPLQMMDVLVLLWSQKMLFEPGRLVLERRALDAWADGKLVVVALDRTFLPVGLRDLPTIDATFEQRRQFTWDEVAAKVRELTQPRRESADGFGAPGGGGPELESKAAAPQARRARVAPAPMKKKGGGPGGLLFGLLVLLVAGAGVWQIVMKPALPILIPDWTLLAVAGGLGVIAIVMALLSAGSRAEAVGAAPPMAAPAPMAEAEEAAKPNSSALFVSYAHADSPSVTPVVEAVKHEGREVWMDKEGIQAGNSWAGEIVRAIKGAHGVMVMCSPHAFESDHVKREVYLADRYKKPMLPVFIEPADLPEDFEYFFANVQWLELHKTPEADRAAAIAKAVAAV